MGRKEVERVKKKDTFSISNRGESERGVISNWVKARLRNLGEGNMGKRDRMTFFFKSYGRFLSCHTSRGDRASER